MPALNDAEALPDAVKSIFNQDYAGPLDVVIAVGPSTDDTELVAFALRDAAPPSRAVTVVRNPTGATAAGLNVALLAATGSIVVRVDAHCELPANYVTLAADTLASTGAVNVGGVQAATGTEPFQAAVAKAMTSRFGVGDAKFHYGGDPGPTDTVYLGVFLASALREVGGFDETLIRNQDYELNWRLRDAGGVIYFNPDMVVKYQPRRTLRSLGSQYFQYGQWKQEVLRRHPRSLKPRQLAAPLLVLGCIAGLLGAFFGRPRALAVPASYGAAVVAAAVSASSSPGEAARLATIFPTMHVCWGVGFFVGAPEIGVSSTPLLVPAAPQ